MAFHALRALAGAVSFPVALTFGAIALAQGCNVTPLTVAGDGEGGAGLDGGDASLGIGLDGGTCQPGDVRTFVPATYRPATPAWQDVCTKDQLDQFYVMCIDSGPESDASPGACDAFATSDPSNAACAACILTPDTSSNYGPLIDHGSFITENVGGCIELTDPSGLVCARAEQALSGCELAACEADCPVQDGASRALFDQCSAQAASVGCQMFASQATCALGIAEAGSSTACVGQTFHDFYYAVVPLFCGASPAPDGGATGIDAPAGDASSGTDASTDAPGTDAGDAAPVVGEGGDAGDGHDAAASDAAIDASSE